MLLAVLLAGLHLKENLWRILMVHLIQGVQVLTVAEFLAR
jgi:hypothetical protein